MKSIAKTVKPKHMQATAAIKTECQAPTLPAVIQRLAAEQALVTAELATLPPDAWLNVRGRALANREQELHITLDVLQRLTQQPAQITEPTH